MEMVILILTFILLLSTKQTPSDFKYTNIYHFHVYQNFNISLCGDEAIKALSSVNLPNNMIIIGKYLSGIGYTDDQFIIQYNCIDIKNQLLSYNTIEINILDLKKYHHSQYHNPVNTFNRNYKYNTNNINFYNMVLKSNNIENQNKRNLAVCIVIPYSRTVSLFWSIKQYFYILSDLPGKITAEYRLGLTNPSHSQYIYGYYNDGSYQEDISGNIFSRDLTWSENGGGSCTVVGRAVQRFPTDSLGKGAWVFIFGGGSTCSHSMDNYDVGSPIGIKLVNNLNFNNQAEFSKLFVNTFDPILFSGYKIFIQGYFVASDLNNRKVESKVSCNSCDLNVRLLKRKNVRDAPEIKDEKYKNCDQDEEMKVSMTSTDSTDEHIGLEIRYGVEIDKRGTNNLKVLINDQESFQIYHPIHSLHDFSTQNIVLIVGIEMEPITIASKYYKSNQDPTYTFAPALPDGIKFENNIISGTPTTPQIIKRYDFQFPQTGLRLISDIELFFIGIRIIEGPYNLLYTVAIDEIFSIPSSWVNYGPNFEIFESDNNNITVNSVSGIISGSYGQIGKRSIKIKIYGTLDFYYPVSFEIMIPQCNDTKFGTADLYSTQVVECEDLDNFVGDRTIKCLEPASPKWLETESRCRYKYPEDVQYETLGYEFELHGYFEIHPIKLVNIGNSVFTCDNLPDGVQIDDKTGVISGRSAVLLNKKYFEVFIEDERRIMTFFMLSILNPRCNATDEYPSIYNDEVACYKCKEDEYGERCVKCVITPDSRDLIQLNDTCEKVTFDYPELLFYVGFSNFSYGPTSYGIVRYNISEKLNGLSFDQMSGNFSGSSTITGDINLDITGRSYKEFLLTKSYTINIIRPTCPEYTYISEQYGIVIVMESMKSNSIFEYKCVDYNDDYIGSITVNCPNAVNPTFNIDNYCVFRVPDSISYSKSSYDLINRLNSLIPSPTVNGHKHKTDALYHISPQLSLKGLFFNKTTGEIQGVLNETTFTPTTYNIKLCNDGDVQQFCSPNTQLTIRISNKFCSGSGIPITQIGTFNAIFNCSNNREGFIEASCPLSEDPRWIIHNDTCAPLTIVMPNSLTFFIKFSNFTYTPIIDGSSNSYKISSLPNGLSLNQDTGMIYGEPITPEHDEKIYVLEACNYGHCTLKNITFNIILPVCPSYSYNDTYTIPDTITGESIYLDCDQYYFGQRILRCKYGLYPKWDEIDNSNCVFDETVRCSWDGSWPEVYSNKTAYISCESNLYGFQIRNCTSGIWGESINNCFHTLPNVENTELLLILSYTLSDNTIESLNNDEQYQFILELANYYHINILQIKLVILTRDLTIQCYLSLSLEEYNNNLNLYHGQPPEIKISDRITGKPDIEKTIIESLHTTKAAEKSNTTTYIIVGVVVGVIVIVAIIAGVVYYVKKNQIKHSPSRPSVRFKTPVERIVPSNSRGTAPHRDKSTRSIILEEMNRMKSGKYNFRGSNNDINGGNPEDIKVEQV